MKKRIFSLALVLVLILALGVGCAPKEPDGGGKAKRVALITDLGGINDESFNQSAWNGMEKLKADGYEISYVESEKEADYAVNFTNKTEEGNDMIWGIGFLMEESVKEASKNIRIRCLASSMSAFRMGNIPTWSVPCSTPKSHLSWSVTLPVM